MAGNTIYMQEGSNYIDIHDNEVVNLNIDKATVRVQSEEKEKEKTEGGSLPESLATKEAMKYWQKLQVAGFVDTDCILVQGVSRKQAMYIADLFSEKLKLPSKWKPFQELWGLKNLAQEKYDMLQNGNMPPLYQKIDEVFKE